MLTKLGHKTSFIGQAGNDIFGKMLKERVASLNITFANTAASLITTKKGALCVMPNESQIMALINQKQ